LVSARQRAALVAAFSYFFRREVETDPELARGLIFDGFLQLFRDFQQLPRLLGRFDDDTLAALCSR
jgi:hypothetical protein